MREHLANFHIAGLTYYDYVLCATALEVGTVLTLKRDTENKFDSSEKDHRIWTDLTITF